MMLQGDREQGTIKMYNSERGYGFIARGFGDDVFFSHIAVERAGLGRLSPGEIVSFTTRHTARGLQAENLQRLAGYEQAGALRERAVGEAMLGARGSPPRSAQIETQYLADGYFEICQGRRYLRPDLLDSQAIEVAQALSAAGMKLSQLRRMLNQARMLSARIDHERDFQAIRPAIVALKRDAAYLVGRKVIPEQFQRFISRNIELAASDAQSFQHGFLPHLESVVAYFFYYVRDV